MREHVEEPRYVTTDDDTVYSLLSKRAARTPDDIIAEWQDDNTHQWRSATATEMLSRVREVAKGLLGLGVKAGTMVLIYSPTCYEWGVADFACAAIGAVVVPVYETDSARQTAGIVEEVDPAIAFAGDFQRAQTLEQIRVNHPGMKYVFNFKADGLDAVVDFGHGVSDETLDAAIARIKADDLLTVVYTSGSTGKPKGAMLSNRNYTHIVLNGYEILRGMLYDDNRLLLFLPLSHVFARFLEFFSFGGTISLALSSNMKTMVKDFETFGPTLLLAVPRVYEKVYNAASQRAGTGFAGKMFMRAAENAREWSKAEQKGEQLPITGRIAHAFYEQVVYKKIRTIFGPNADFAITGGAPMDSELSHFFNGIGMPVLEGYGMTETCGPVCVSLPEDNRIGTIGMPMCGITAGIAEDGELVVKGPLVCRGYHNNPEVTTQQITDGWLHTGDLGDISEDGFISITGRKKDLIITAGGKNVSPGLLEASVMTSPVVNQCLVIGDKKPFVAALVTLDLADANKWLESQGAKPEPDLASLAKNAIVHAEVERAVNAANEGVSRAESIRKFEILPDEFTEANGMLTPSLKTRRAQIVEHYRELIDDVIYVPLKK